MAVDSASARPAPPRRLRRRLIVAAAALLPFAAAGGYYLYVRVLTTNLHAVVPGQVYRSAQPSGEELADWAGRLGLRSVLCLRTPVEPDEQSAADRLGLRVVPVRVSAGELPPAAELRLMIESIESLPRPLLIHCRAGADRTGLASVLAAMAVGGRSLAEARDQLSIRYLHLADRPGRIEGLLDLYERSCAAAGQPTDGWASFRRWAMNDYAPPGYDVRLSGPAALSAAPGEEVAVEITVHNASADPLGGGRKLGLAAVLGRTDRPWQSARLDPPRLLGGWTLLAEPAIPPGGTRTIRHTLAAPRTPGQYAITFDLAEDHGSWLGHQGGRPAGCTLTVLPAAP